MCGSRKYPYPITEGIENSNGVGESEAQEIPEGRGLDDKNHFSRG